MLLKPVWRDEIYAVLNLKKQSKSKPQTKAFSTQACRTACALLPAKSSSAFTSFFLVGCLCSRQSWEQTLVRGTRTEVGLKPQLSPWDNATKEEELKSLLMAQGTTDSHPSCWLCKPSACTMSEWMSAPEAQIGLALPVVDFVGTHG